ncbi:MAG TPA: pyruvate kinase [Longimicrobium sp.]|nr:pyruvate kinase [Longimicrobium sp.]
MATELLSAPPAHAELEDALHTLEQVRRGLLEHEHRFAAVLAGLPEAARPSAANLVHYLGLRSHDLGPVQRVLAAHGLSSLGRAEPHVLANLDAVLHALRSLTGGWEAPGGAEAPTVAFADGERLRRERAEALFGPAPAGRPVRIMATMPAEAAADYALVRELLAGGMDCMRVNCAHDGPEAWAAMAEHLRRARTELSRPCVLLMDLPGPRVRTGEVEPGPRVVKVKPVRDELGRVVRPARVWLTAAEAPAPPPAPADAALPLPGGFLARLEPGTRLRFRDTRGARRRLRVEEVDEGGAWALLKKTAYVATGTELRVRGPGGRVRAAVGGLPPVPRRIPLRAGDLLLLTADPSPGRAAVQGDDGAVAEPARIPCAPPEALARVVPGAPVWFDDGRIGGVVEAADEQGVRVRITRARGAGRLGAEKGVNFPGTELGLPPLTPDDLRILPFICGHADLAGYSFARTAADVRRLRRELERAGAPEMGIILKIENTAAFQELPVLLLEALRCRAAGVMIARGDLAVEAGFERLAEVQEEILWMCEAAHVPVVWATQVLESLTRDGAPSRAEVSDAALGERAECVMLNKGPYLADAVRTLDDILCRMHRHQEKKRPLLAHLGVADHFFALVPGPDGEARPPGEEPAGA